MEHQPVGVYTPKKLLRATGVVGIPLTGWNQNDLHRSYVTMVLEPTFWPAFPFSTLYGASEEKTFYPTGYELFFTAEHN